MQRMTRMFFGSLLVAASLWPAAAWAQIDSIMTVDQVRGAFRVAGYQVDPAYRWGWMQPPVTSFEVTDQSSGRVLMVLVYQSATAADGARLQAQSHEQAANAAQVVGSNPHMVVGFGASTWRGNVAMVETTQSQLMRLAQAQIERDQGMNYWVLDDEETGAPNIAVDLDFQQALANGAVNL